MEKQTGRFEAFSDGIFAVAITMLAMEIGIREYAGSTNSNLWHKILEHWPEYFSYFNSFATVLLIWTGHHKIFKNLHKINRWVILLNGLSLLLVALFPFPTRLVGTFLGTSAQDTAIAFYAGYTGFITFSMLLLNLCIVKNPVLLISPEKSLPMIKNMIRGQVIGFLVYEGAALLAFYNSYCALAITFLMWVFWGIVTKDEKEDLNDSK